MSYPSSIPHGPHLGQVGPQLSPTWAHLGMLLGLLVFDIHERVTYLRIAMLRLQPQDIQYTDCEGVSDTVCPQGDVCTVMVIAVFEIKDLIHAPFGCRGSEKYAPGP